MSGDMILLEQWVRETAGMVQGRKRQFYIFFQKDWTQSHMNNPLLFPMEQAPDQWKAHFDWFLAFETFKPANQIKEAAPPQSKPEKKPAAVPPTQSVPLTTEKASTETVVMDAMEDVEDLKTMIYEASAREADQGTVVMQAQAGDASRDGTGGMTAESEPVLDDGENDPGDLDDLVEAHQAEAPLQAPSAGTAKPMEPRTEDEAYTIVMEEPVPEGDHDGTVVMDAEPESTPPPKPEAPKAPAKKAKPAADGDMELEFDDLDDLDWM